MEIGNPRNPTDFANALAPTFLVGPDASPGASEPWARDAETSRVFEDALVLQLGELLPPVDIDASTSGNKVNELPLDVLPTDFAARSASHGSYAAPEGNWEPIDALTPKSTDPVVSAPGHATPDQLARGQTFEIVRLPIIEAASAEKASRSTAHHQMLTSEAVLPLPESDGDVISVTDNVNASTPIDRPTRGGTPELADQPDKSVRSSTNRPTVQEPPSDADVASTSAAMVNNSTAPLVSEDSGTTSPMKDRHASPVGNGQLIDALTSKSMDVIEFVSAYELLDQNVPVQASAALRFPTVDETSVENATLSDAQTSHAATFASNGSYAAADGNRPPVSSVSHKSTDPAASIPAQTPLNHTVPSRARETARLSRIGTTSVTEVTLADTQNDAVPIQAKHAAHQTDVVPVHAKVAANQADVVLNQAQALAHQTDLGPTHSDVAENQSDVVPDRAHVAPVHRFGATDVGEDVGTVSTSQQFSRQGPTTDLPRAVVANLGELENQSTLPEVAGGHSMTMTTTTLDLANRAHGNDGSSASTDPTRPLPRQLADHIISARREVSKGTTRIEITLDPPELGRVFIEIENTQNRLLARLLVAEPTTLQSIRAELPTLLNSLADAGVTIDEFEFGQFHDAQTSSSETDGQEPSDEQATFSSTPPADSDRTDPISAATHLGVDVMA